MRSLKLLVLCAPLLVFACGDDGGGVDVDTLCNEEDGLFLEVIDKLFECNPEFEDFLFVEQSRADAAEGCVATFEGAADDGWIAFGSGSEAAKCREALAAADCESFDFDLLPECQDVADGTQPNGEGCEVDLQCSGDSFCDRPSEDTCGVCLARKPDSASCDDGDECIGRNCSEGVCLTPGEVDDDCASDDDCLGRLSCNRVNDRCQRLEDWSEGNACTPDTSDCGVFVNDLYCDGQSEECVAFLNVGDDCGIGMPLCNFVQGEHCDLGKCAVNTLVGEGERCDLFLGRSCDRGLLCDGFPSGECVRPAAAGDACDEGDEQPCRGTVLLECVDGVCQYGDYVGECPAATDGNQ